MKVNEIYLLASSRLWFFIYILFFFFHGNNTTRLTPQNDSWWWTTPHASLYLAKEQLMNLYCVQQAMQFLAQCW